MEKILKETYSFDDLLLVPAYSDFVPSEADVSTKLTKNITLNIPIVSAAMDTVTESKMAIAIARHGGIGIIHRNMTIKDQAKEIELVKKSESGMILNPITAKETDLVKDVTYLMEKYKISGVPIVNDKKNIIGILTNRDLRFLTQQDLYKPVSLFMTSKNLITAKEGITLEEAVEILKKHKIEKLPIVDENGVLKGLITIKDIIKKKEYPFASKDKYGRLMVGAAVGTGPDTMDRVEALIEAGVDVIAVDTAHGHSLRVLKVIEEIKSRFNIDVIGGNIATKEGARDIIKAGADAVKVGIGPGSICTTRIVSGVGVPQVSAIMDAYEAVKEENIPLIADGGIRHSGDITKALAAGADCVMLGNLLAGTEEAPGERIFYQGRAYKVYRGMGSIGAMISRISADRYSQENLEKFVPEGIEGRVPYKGAISDVLYQLVGGLKSGMGYTGSKTIKELKEKAKFVKITAAGYRESHVHDVAITKEAPNYSID